MSRDYINNNVRGVTPGSLLTPATALWLLARAVSLFLRWSERIDGRHRLGQLDERMLRDIGLSRGDVERERRKYFWEV